MLSVPHILRHVLSSAAIIASQVGCGGESSLTGKCELRSGTYRSNFVERTGTCGPMPEQIFTFDEQPLEPPVPCTSGEIRYSKDNCEVTNVDVVCPEDGVARGATSTLNGKYTWSSDASFGSGQLHLVVKNLRGAVLCQSTYNVEVNRL